MKKSKLFGMAAMAAMMLGSCSTDEVVNDYSPENAIQFGTYVGRNAESRATVIDNVKLAEDHFGVYAYYTGTDSWNTTTHTPNFMSNQMVEGTVTTNVVTGWTYSPTKYWPNNNGAKLTFFAYAPYCADPDPLGNETNITSVPANNTTGYPSIGFEVNETVASQTDLLYADVDKDDSKLMDLTKQTVNDEVKFHFKHALSKIAFYAETVIDKVNDDPDNTEDDSSETDSSLGSETTVTITNVSLRGTFYPSGSLNLRTGSWTKDTAEEITYSMTSDNFADNGEVSDNRTQLNKDDSYIMIIPRDEDGAEESITISVTYKVKTTDTNLNNGYSEIENTNTSTFDFDKFEQGKSYAFALHIGLTSVSITAEVADWGAEAFTSVNVPINTGTDNP